MVSLVALARRERVVVATFYSVLVHLHRTLLRIFGALHLHRASTPTQGSRVLQNPSSTLYPF